MNKNKKLIFIYNAKGGLINGAVDYLHKIIFPETYSCNLCSLTYDNLGMIEEWEDFINSISISIKFIYKNDDNYLDLIKSNKNKLPAIWLESDGDFSIFFTKNQINQEKTLGGLVKLVKSKIN